jgi:Family of unknown function (DUF6273)
VTLPSTNYSAVASSRRRVLKGVFIAVGVVVAAIAAAVVITVVIPTMRYDQAVTDFNNKDYAAAAVVFGELGSWSDSPSYLLKAAKANTQLADGDALTWMGVYEGSPIAWEHLDSWNGAQGLVSRYVIQSMPYQEGKVPESLTWKGSSIRKWLNGKFLSSAFTPAQRKVLAKQAFEPSDYEIPNNISAEILEPQTTDTVSLVLSGDLDQVPTHNGYTRSTDGTVSTYAQDWWLKSSFLKLYSTSDGKEYNGKKIAYVKWAQEGSGSQYWYNWSTSMANSAKGVRPVIYVKS